MSLHYLSDGFCSWCDKRFCSWCDKRFRCYQKRDNIKHDKIKASACVAMFLSLLIRDGAENYPKLQSHSGFITKTSCCILASVRSFIWYFLGIVSILGSRKLGLLLVTDLMLKFHYDVWGFKKGPKFRIRRTKTGWQQNTKVTYKSNLTSTACLCPPLTKKLVATDGAPPPRQVLREISSC